MLYYHFGNKAELFGAVVEETYRRLWQAEEALELSQTEPERGMRELVAFTWHYFVDHPEFIRLLNSENLQGGANVKKSRGIARLSSPFIRTLTDLLQRGARAGTFRRGLDPVLVYITIAALAYFYAANQHTLSHFLNRELMARRAQALAGAHHRRGARLAAPAPRRCARQTHCADIDKSTAETA
jgi:AcrR family transcriptional regulator